MSVGAQPTNAVARVLNRFGDEIWPKVPIPLGSNSVYEKPKKIYYVEGARDTWSKHENRKYKYKQMLQEQFNLIERKKRVQMEAMDNFGEGKYA